MPEEATGQPRYEIRTCKAGPSKGSPYFVLIDSQGNIKYESNVYYMGEPDEREYLCEFAAKEDLKVRVESGRIQ